jgi:hypothetical protein
MHQDKPLPGVRVLITSNSEAAQHQSFSGFTGPDEIAQFANLPSGDYWIEASLLGIDAGYECFHITASPSRKSKNSRRYEWGDMAPAFRKAAGPLVYSKPGTGGSPLDNLLRRVKVPIAEAKLEIRQPISGTCYDSVSGENGYFTFEEIPDGIYVLHIEVGPSASAEPYSTDVLIQLGQTARAGPLLLVRRDAGAGSCGGISLEIESRPN